MSDSLAMAFALWKRFLRATGGNPDGNWFDKWIWPPVALSVLTLSVCSVLAFLLFAFMVIQPYSSSPFPEQAIHSIFDGKSNPLQNPELEIECRGFECADVIPRLPAATQDLNRLPLLELQRRASRSAATYSRARTRRHKVEHRKTRNQARQYPVSSVRLTALDL